MASETNCTTYGTPPHVMLVIYRLIALQSRFAKERGQ